MCVILYIYCTAHYIKFKVFERYPNPRRIMDCSPGSLEMLWMQGEPRKVAGAPRGTKGHQGAPSNWQIMGI